MPGNRRAEWHLYTAVQASAAVWQALFGNAAAARQRANAALDLSKGRDVEYAAAVAFAISGDASQSQALADDLERRFPEDTSVQFNYLPALRGLRALNNNEPAKAIELLQTATSHELAVTGSTFSAFFGMFYPVYFRGEAYMATHQGAEAAKQFQTILDHRGLAFNDPIGALARLQLARTEKMAGEKAKASLRRFSGHLERCGPRRQSYSGSQGGVCQNLIMQLVLTRQCTGC